VTTFDDTDAPPGEINEYRVLAFDALTASDPSGIATANTMAGGTGLRGEYFDTVDLTGPAVTRNDAHVGFDWGGAQPASGIAPGTFSVRWTGQVMPYRSGDYTFFTTADDGVRLWVNGRLLIDRWSNRPKLFGDANGDGVVNFTDYQIFQTQDRTSNPQSDFNGDGVVNFTDFQLLFGNMHKTLADTTPTDYGSITLEAGVKYDLRLEYYQDEGIAAVKLGWVTPTHWRELIPMDQLFVAAPPLPTPAPPQPVVAPPISTASVVTRPVAKPAGTQTVTLTPTTRPAATKPVVVKPRPAARPLFCALPLKKQPPAPQKKAVYLPSISKPNPKPAPLPVKGRH
jgi:hypothetical protein